MSKINDFYVLTGRKHNILLVLIRHLSRCFLVGFDDTRVGIFLDPDFFVTFEENVIRFEVSMHHPYFFELGAGLEHLLAHDLQCVHGLAVLPVALYLVLGRFAQFFENHAVNFVVA